MRPPFFYESIRPGAGQGAQCTDGAPAGPREGEASGPVQIIFATRMRVMSGRSWKA